MSDHAVIALFCGSRDWSDRESIRAEVEALPPDSIVIEGGACGADRIAREEAWRWASTPRRCPPCGAASAARPARGATR